MTGVFALPGSSAAQTPTQDSATGTGGTSSYTSFAFNVVSGPSGENPTGSSQLDLPAFGLHTQSAAIICLSVNGNTATFVTQLMPNSFGFTYGKLTVVDNGPQGSGLDTYAAAGYFNLQDCSSPETGALGTQPLLTGDIVVVDAPPLPTAKEQCENGGWQTYGLFKNQGDCVSFVATGGQNAPGAS
jgi:hypothetical protein